MERLTKVLPKTVVYTKGKYEDTVPAEMTTEDTRTVLKKLAEYEDIGTPTELKQLKENGGFTGLELAEIATALKELQAYREQELMDTSVMKKLSMEDIDLKFIPASVLQDVDKRISDWRSMGGKDSDEYIQNQLRYLKRVELMANNAADTLTYF